MDFLYLYQGGSMPETPEGMEEMTAKWQAYYAKLGDNLSGGGAPFGDRAHVGPAKPSAVTGYTQIKANDLEHAQALTEGHPHLDYGGGIEVVHCMDMN